MANVFMVSDTHFGHRNMCRGGSIAIRPFDSADEMDEKMVENWNGIVKPEDRVYHLGDVSMPRRGLKVLARLNGSKCLIKGNHDIWPLKDFLPYFDDIRGVHKLDAFIMSHVPVHPSQLVRFKYNVHGHVHAKSLADHRYLNVCVEQTNYTPVSLEDVIQTIKLRQSWPMPVYGPGSVVPMPAGN